MKSAPLLKYIQNKYSESEPIFLLSMDGSGRNNEILLNVKKEPHLEIDENDPLSVLVMGCFQQNFNKAFRRFSVNEDDIAQMAFSKILRSFCVFIEKNLEVVSPRNTKVFRFFKYDCEKVPSDIIIYLWSYMKPFVDDGYRFTDKTNNRVHFDNIINLLKAIESKYG